MTHRTTLILLCLLMLVAVPRRAHAEAHGAGGSNEDDGKEEDSVAAPSGSASSFLIESSRRGGTDARHGSSKSDAKPGADGGKHGPGPNAKGTGANDGVPARVTGYPVFIFADGPRYIGDRDPKAGEAISKPIREVLKRSIPGAHVLRVAPLTTAALANSWEEARRKDPDNTSLVTTALLVVNAKAVAGSGGLGLMTAEGLVPEAKWRDAIQHLSQSIFTGAAGGPNGRQRLETVLLTDDAGAIDCRRFPGPVFGMTQEGQARQAEALQLWLDFQRKPDSFFPATAREWFDSWAITYKINRRRYFYCPTENTRGHLGAMRATEEPPP